MEKSIKADNPKRSRCSEKKIRALLEKYNAQDKLSVRKFSKKHKIHRATFYNWLKTYSNKNAPNKEQKTFVPIEVRSTTVPVVSDIPALFAEVNGIRLYHLVSPDYLKALLP